MRYNDILNENQINELGIIKNIKGAIQGARAGYQASKLQKKGIEHSGRIVNNIRAEFQQMVGGGIEPTYDNLIDFLQDLGLSDVESIPNPTANAAATLAKAGQQAMGADGVPNLAQAVSEAVAGTLNAKQIDDIIKAAVKKNYARIVAAQKGRTIQTKSVQPAEQPEEPQQAATATDSGTAPETPQQQAPAAPQRPAPAAPQRPAPAAPQRPAPAVKPEIEAIKKAYSMLDQKSRDQLRNELDILDDQERLATGTNESKIKVMSKFLGREL